MSISGRLSEFLVAGRTLSVGSKESFSKIPLLNNKTWKDSESEIKVFSGPMASHYLFFSMEDQRSVYGWGRCLEGQLGRKGIGCSTFVAPDDPILVCNTEAKILFAACGPYHSLIALEDGTIHSLGRNTHGELGSPGTNQQGSFSHSFSVTEAGSVLRFPYIAAGTDFSISLSDCGSLYAWGRNDEGQLGHKGESTEIATKIVSLPPVSQVSVGWGHCLVLSRQGKVYGWGANNHGQVGNNEKSTAVHSPAEIILPEPFNISDKTDSRAPIQVTPVEVNCGGTNSALLAKENISNTYHLFTWGSHKDGKLGLGKDTDSLHGERVNIENPILVQSGCDHSIVLDSKKRLWGWGFSQHFSLGKGNEKLILDVPYNLSPINVDQILCNQDDTLLHINKS